MRRLFLTIGALLTIIFVQAQQNNPQYDEALAQRLQADIYGMKMYFLVILKTGSNTNPDPILQKESFRQHLSNIQRLVEDKKLVIAGPLGKNDLQYRGIFIFHQIDSEDELKSILDTDLAIQNKYLEYDIIPWYGSAALPEYLDTADKIWQEKP